MPGASIVPANQEPIITEAPPFLYLTVEGNAFLYHMVRNIIGTLANVGLGVLTPARFGEILEGRDRTKASATAPACGLYLEHVDYGEAFHF